MWVVYNTVSPPAHKECVSKMNKTEQMKPSISNSLLSHRYKQ